MKLTCGAVIERIPSISLDDEQRVHWLRWIEALESGSFKQIKFALRDTGGFCCLGVACDLINPKGWVKEEEPLVYSFHLTTSDKGLQTSKDHLVPTARRWYGLEMGPLGFHVGGRFPDGDGNTLEISSLALAGINDMGATFTEIAEILRKAMNGGYVCSVALVR